MTQRVFYPGSNWLYFKIYTSIKNADKLLVNNLSDYTDDLYKKKLIDKWFFIRYNDPQNHIRLRIHLSSLDHFSEIFSLFNLFFEKEMVKGSVWNLKIDTYSRELERYGSERIEEVESIFWIDSLSISNLLREIDSSSDKYEIRWQTGLLLVDGLFDAFDYSLDERSQLINHISNSYLQEFNFKSAIQTKQLNDKYRKNRSLIEKVMKKVTVSVSEQSLIEKRNFQITEIFQIINNNGKIKKEDHDSLLSSLIHMSMNRLFISNNRANELVLYYLLSKYYNSFKARQKMNII